MAASSSSSGSSSSSSYRSESTQLGNPGYVSGAKKTDMARYNGSGNTGISSAISGSGRIQTMVGSKLPARSRPPKGVKFISGKSVRAAQSKSLSHSAYSGHSQYENTVTYGIVVEAWSSTNYHRDIFEGQLLFTSVSKSNLGRTIAISLRNMNNYLRARYYSADLFFRKLLTDDSLGSHGFTSDDARELVALDTNTWKNHKAFTRALKSDSNALKHLAFLTEFWCGNSWNFYGIALGQISQDLDTVVVPVARYGIIEEGENIFPRGLPGDHMYLILKRYYNEETGRYEAFQFVPWSGPDQPSLDDRFYIDYTGNEKYGRVIYLGQILWWNRSGKFKMPKKEFEVQTGLREADENRRFIGPYERQSKFVLSQPNGRKHNYLF